jgi:hypothetical protein
MRKLSWLLTVLALAVTSVASAQERVPTEQAQQIAKVLTQAAEKQADLPLKLEPDTDKPFAVRQEQFGAMAIPAKGLSADAIAKAEKEVVPIGQFWMRSLIPTIDGAPAAASKVRSITIEVEENKVDVTFYQLGVRKGEKGDLELIVYGAGKDPLVTKTLEKADSAQSYPIELEGREDDNNTGLITLFISGKYRAIIRVSPML